MRAGNAALDTEFNVIGQRFDWHLSLSAEASAGASVPLVLSVDEPESLGDPEEELSINISGTAPFYWRSHGSFSSACSPTPADWEGGTYLRTHEFARVEEIEHQASFQEKGLIWLLLGSDVDLSGRLRAPDGSVFWQDAWQTAPASSQTSYNVSYIWPHLDPGMWRIEVPYLTARNSAATYTVAMHLDLPAWVQEAIMGGPLLLGPTPGSGGT